MHDPDAGRGQRRWDTDATRDYPIGPDDAGNAVMHAIGFVVSAWRRLVGKMFNRRGRRPHVDGSEEFGDRRSHDRSAGRPIPVTNQSGPEER